jgi:hypothetical protein
LAADLRGLRTGIRALLASWGSTSGNYRVLVEYVDIAFGNVVVSGGLPLLNISNGPQIGPSTIDTALAERMGAALTQKASNFRIGATDLLHAGETEVRRLPYTDRLQTVGRRFPAHR